MGLQTEIIQAVLFDIDGTLSDSDDLMVRRVEKAMRPFFKKHITRQSIARWLVMAMESPGNYFYNLVDQFDLDSLFIRLLHAISKAKVHKVKKYWIIPGINEMLTSIGERFQMGVVSARDDATSWAFIDQFKLQDHFRVVVTSQTCRFTKPFPDPLLFAARVMGIEPGACLMVGDTTVDIKAAKLAGMQAIGVLCGFGRKKELERAGADVILPSTIDLPDILST